MVNSIGDMTMDTQFNQFDEAYAQGFSAKCAELGVDPEAVAKVAECVTSGEAYKDIEATKGKSKTVKAKKVKEAFDKLSEARKVAELREPYPEEYAKLKSSLKMLAGEAYKDIKAAVGRTHSHTKKVKVEKIKKVQE